MSDKNKDIQYQKNWDSNKKKAKFGLEMGEGDLSFCQLTLCFTYFQNVVMIETVGSDSRKGLNLPNKYPLNGVETHNMYGTV